MRAFTALAVTTISLAIASGVPAYAASPGSAPTTAPAASAPAAPAAPAIAPDTARGQAGEELDTVYEVVKTPKGYAITVFDPAAGVSNAQLRSELAKAGHKVLAKGTNPGDAIAAASGSTSLTATAAAVSTTCQSYGTAREWCGHRWAANGFEDPAVYMLDHTSSAWPVTAATNTWYQAQGIDAYYRWYTNGCPGGGRHCVNVYNAYYGATGWAGLTTWGTDSTGDYDNTTNVTVKLNDTYGGTAANHRNVACHELGHALGLAHNTSTGSCLYYMQGTTLYPNSDDFNILPRMYGY